MLNFKKIKKCDPQGFELGQLGSNANTITTGPRHPNTSASDTLHSQSIPRHKVNKTSEAKFATLATILIKTVIGI